MIQWFTDLLDRLFGRNKAADFSIQISGQEITMAVTMDSVSKVTISASGKNAKGNPAALSGVVFDSANGAGKITIFPLPDGKSADILGIGAGSATVTITAIGKTKTVDFTITAAPAVDFDITVSPVSAQ